MGKSKRYKKKATSNPTGLPSIQDTLREEVELGSNLPDHMSKHETAVQTIIEQLHSLNVEDKLFGLQTLATNFQDDESVTTMLHYDVIKMVGPLLLDPSSSVKNSAAGALRNISVSGGADICDHLIEHDVMTPLLALLHMYACDWQPAKPLDEYADTFIQAIHLLWNLCENNSTAVKYFNDSNLMPILIKCLDTEVFGFQFAVSVAQCLHTITEDNPIAIAQLMSSESLVQNLLTLEGSDNTQLLLKTLACGLVLNLNFGKLSNLSPMRITQMMWILSSILEVDHRKAVNVYVNALPMDETSWHKEGEESMMKDSNDIQHLLEAQQTAIEILANLCSDDDGEDDTMDVESSDASDEILSDSGFPDEYHTPEEKFPIHVPSQVYEGILTHNLVQKIWEKTVLPAENMCQILKDHPYGKPTFTKLLTLRCRSLLCLNNLLVCLSLEDLGGPKVLLNMCHDIFKTFFQETEADNTRCLEPLTSALRAGLQKLAEAKLLVKQDFTSFNSHFKNIIIWEPKIKDASVRANLVRSIGSMFTLLINEAEPQYRRLIKDIGRFLVDVCTKDMEQWVIAEALDTIMDVFGEDETDLVAANIALVDKLQALLPTLKHKVRLQKKSLGDHYLVITTVNMNLGRFIKYKAKRLSLSNGCKT